MIGLVLLYRAEMISQLIGELVNRDFGETFVNRLTIEVKFKVKLPNFSHLKMSPWAPGNRYVDFHYYVF